ncbi:unnamed protein product [Orchesella dallaii]|uniref:Elongation of very long chain fatty acids protein n=1 Tax=Orchesella dallaii TaxID=48710 RepID=A0ABP1QPZ5_9HEXA
MEKEAQDIFLENISNQDPLAGMLPKSIDMIGDPVSSPSYMETLDFEKNFPYNDWRIWMGQNWKLALHISFLYIMGIFLGQKWMKGKQPYKLDNLLRIWNLLLAAFSLAGFLRSIPEVAHLLHRPNGFYRISCSRDDYNVASAYWSFIGTLSKVCELGDTAFLVLRKRPVMFLHWYHHATVMLYTWYTYEDNDPCHRWFIVMNYFVHTIMYTYYALRAMGFRLPRSVSMLITSLQIGQMIGGALLNIHGFVMLSQGIPCSRKLHNIKLALLMYMSYLLLFAHFFYTSYLTPKRKTRHPHSH